MRGIRSSLLSIFALMESPGSRSTTAHRSALPRTSPQGTSGRAESWLPFSVDLKNLSSGKWTPAKNLIRLDFGRKSGVTLRLRDLQLRPPTDSESQSQADRLAERNAKLAQESRVNEYYDIPFESALDVSVTKSGETRVRAEAKEPCALIRIRPWVPTDLVENGLLPVIKGVEKDEDLSEAGEISLDFIGTYPASRWALAKKLPGGWKLLSSMTFASSVKSHQDLDRKTPKSIKGMNGIDLAVSSRGTN